MDDAAAATQAGVAKAAKRLAYLSLVIVAVLTLWLVAIPLDHPWRAGTIVLLKTYCALSLGFVGGTGYGLALGAVRAATPALVVATVLAPLVAWVALSAPDPHSFAILALAWAGQGALDGYAVHRGLAPVWYGRLRLRLTLCMVGAMVLAMLATAGQPG